MIAKEEAQPQRQPSRAERVVEEVCAYYDLDPAVLRTHRCERFPGCGCRERHCRFGCSPRGIAYTTARWLICVVLDEDLAMAHTRMGLLLQRDHSTITHALRRARAHLAARRDLRWHLHQLRVLLREKGVVPDA